MSKNSNHLNRFRAELEKMGIPQLRAIAAGHKDFPAFIAQYPEPTVQLLARFIIEAKIPQSEVTNR